MTVFSTPEQLSRIRAIVSSYSRLPFSGRRVPGEVLEGAFAHVRGARRLGRYDFVDVVDEIARAGWQVKSTGEKTPVTWKRAKIAGRDDLIRRSEVDADGVRACLRMGVAAGVWA